MRANVEGSGTTASVPVPWLNVRKSLPALAVAPLVSRYQVAGVWARAGRVAAMLRVRKTINSDSMEGMAWTAFEGNWIGPLTATTGGYPSPYATGMAEGRPQLAIRKVLKSPRILVGADPVAIRGWSD